MTNERSQAFWAPGGSTVRIPQEMCLATAERERLWKGLERFANCGDPLNEYRALGRAFPKLWPTVLWFNPSRKPRHSRRIGTEIIAPSISIMGGSTDQESEESHGQDKTEELSWHPACHGLFLFYRDTLRALWSGEEDELPKFGARAEDFLLGTSDLLASLFAEARLCLNDPGTSFPKKYPSSELSDWCRTIVQQFPTVQVTRTGALMADWDMGDFCFYPVTDFQIAFYLLFRQSWKARVCPRCSKFLVARKPKQIFCDTACSAGNRLDSKLKWWRKVGAKRRSALSETKPKQTSKGQRGRNKQ